MRLIVEDNSLRLIVEDNNLRLIVEVNGLWVMVLWVMVEDIKLNSLCRVKSIFSKIISLCLLATLMACQTTTQPTATTLPKTNERVLLATNNLDALITHYKMKIKQKPDVCLRYQLALAYLNNKDAEASLFHLTMLENSLGALKNTAAIAEKNSKNPDHVSSERSISISKDKQQCFDDYGDFSANVSLLSAQAHYQLNQNDKATFAVQKALSAGDKQAEAYNLYGMLLSDKGQVKAARMAFNESRSLMHDDVIIKNNLAVLDIVEEKYLDAINKLLPLYQNNLQDQQVKGNLILALARAQHFKLFRTLLEKSKSTEQIVALYQYLNTTSAKTQAGQYQEKNQEQSQVQYQEQNHAPKPELVF